jgi:outer membrane protein assembly factor BamB
LARILSLLLAIAFCSLTCSVLRGEPQRVLLQGNDKLAIVDRDGQIEWQMPWGPIHDIHVLENGHIMVQRGLTEVVEIDPETKTVVWSYDAAKENGNEGKRVEAHSFQPLANDRVLIAESGTARLIEVDRSGKLHKEVALKVKKPHHHSDTRLVRKLATGNYLVCQENDGAVREYDGKSGEVVWEYEVPLLDRPRRPGHGPEAFGNQVFCALRLASGNTLVATGNGHGVLEVTPEKEIVWQLSQHDLPEITLAWVTTLEVLPNGHYVIGNCHAGPENPLVVEVDPATKQVVWQLDQHDVFGDSVSNSVLLDLGDKSIR